MNIPAKNDVENAIEDAARSEKGAWKRLEGMLLDLEHAGADEDYLNKVRVYTEETEQAWDLDSDELLDLGPYAEPEQILDQALEALDDAYDSLA